MKPNQVWSWDITWLPTIVRGLYLRLYLVMDVWSRRIVGWRIAEVQSADIAAELITQACQDGRVDPRGLVLHSDNGKAMRASTLIATLQWLGVIPSFSRPHVSDDNPYSERQWVTRFIHWYNGEHRHSAIRYVTPDERHYGLEHEILARRHQLYQRARRSWPQRWTRNTRNWTPVGSVVLHPQGVTA
jgi:transposase InsO family protein